MEIGLVDLYTNGHHLPYASRTKAAIEDASSHSVTFLTLTSSPRCSRLFDEGEVAYLDDQSSPCIEERKEAFDDVADRTLREFLEGGQAEQFDVLHFLFADDILGPLHRYAKPSDRPRMVGELNGVFFERKLPLRQPYVHPLFLATLGSPLGPIIDRIFPEHTDHEQLWRDLHLYRCLRHRTFDHLVTHSREADEYVSRLDPNEVTPVSSVPYPAPVDFGVDLSQSAARERLELPADATIVLYFGTLRKEKGIHQLLRVLRHYEGPEFTMHIAGPPVDVSEEEVLAVGDASPLDVVTELGYVDAPEIYFRAADALVLPYPRVFGRECTSQSLEEASSSLLPVVVPDFGAIGRVTREWGLGTTYEPDSDAALENTLGRVVREGFDYSERRVEQYNRRHSYERAASVLLDVYSGRTSRRFGVEVSSSP